MLIGSRQRISTFHSAPTLTLEHVSHTKSLGVQIDENLSWNEHINKVSKKIASGIEALKRIRPFVPTTTLQFIFNSLIQPNFNYCSVVLDDCSKILADKLRKLQNRTARVLTFSNYGTSANPLIWKLSWKKLEIQRKIQKAVMVYKSLRGLAPGYLRSLFTDRSS